MGHPVILKKGIQTVQNKQLNDIRCISSIFMAWLMDMILFAWIKVLKQVKII